VATRLLLRAASGLLVLCLVSVLAFGLLALAPGDPARLVLGAQGIDTPSAEVVAAKRAELRLDAPPLRRYLGWAAAALRGDFGASYRTGASAWAMYAERLPATLGLASLALVLSLGVALPLGIIAALRRGTVLDGVIQLGAALGAALPPFWIALVLILVFAATLRWLPALGSPSPRGMLLPACVLAMPNIALLARLARASVLDALHQDYMTTARAKGHSRRSALLVHAMPNAALALVPVVALEIAYLLTGTVVVETVFAFPGVGRLAVDAALVGDMPVVAVCVVMAGMIYVVCNWSADAVMGALDPRIRTT
jgi:peptide/nickel transport system permease protein